MKTKNINRVLVLIMFLTIFVVSISEQSWGRDFIFMEEKIIFHQLPNHEKEKLEKEIIIEGLRPHQLVLYKKRAGKFFPFIERVLKEKWLPDDLKYLAVAESGLRNTVFSSQGAAGVWQFIPETGRRYGLQVDTLIDERLHFEKSTLAATEYLSDLYDKFQNWELAMAAYNRGENGLQRDMNSQNISNYRDIYLNPETSRYVYRIMGIKHVMTTPMWHLSGKIINHDLFQEKKEDTLRVQGPIENLLIWSQKNNHNYSLIREQNPWTLTSYLPDGDWELSYNEK